MIAICQQPNYFPWLGYLEQCARADVFVVLDSVQWIKQGRQHRARILPHASNDKNGFQWLSLPVKSQGHRNRQFKDLELDTSQDWQGQHWKTLQAVYGRAPCFKNQFEPILRPWFEKARSFSTLYEASMQSVELCLELLELKPLIVRSSELPEHGRKTERLISILKHLEADVYYSALGSTRYIDVSLFRAASIELVWQHWRGPKYSQQKQAFKSHLSILDALAFVPLPTIQSWFAPSEYSPFARLNQD